MVNKNEQRGVTKDGNPNVCCCGPQVVANGRIGKRVESVHALHAVRFQIERSRLCRVAGRQSNDERRRRRRQRQRDSRRARRTDRSHRAKFAWVRALRAAACRRNRRQPPLRCSGGAASLGLASRILCSLLLTSKQNHCDNLNYSHRHYFVPLQNPSATFQKFELIVGFRPIKERHVDNALFGVASRNHSDCTVCRGTYCAATSAAIVTPGPRPDRIVYCRYTN
jgi:hypothetical protein